MKHHKWIPSRGLRLSAMLHRPAGAGAGTPLVVCCHGFTGDKVGANQLMLNLGRAIAAEGLFAVRFDFAGSGESEGDFSSETTIGGWQEDLRQVLAWTKSQQEFAGSPLFLLGHSLGGLVTLTCHEPGITGRIALAPVMRPYENFRDIILGSELWQKSAAGETIANFYGKGFSLGPGFVRDLLERNDSLLAAAPHATEPLIVIHGDSDAAVPIAGSQELFEAYRGPKEMRTIAADHVFTGRHREVGRIVTEWLFSRK